MSDSYIPNPHPTIARYATNGQQLVDFLAVANDGFVINDRHELAGRPDIVTVRLLPEARTQPVIIPRGLIMHTQAGPRMATNEQLWTWCERGTNLEPHIIGPQMDDGKLIQAMPFNVRADCNYLGNRWTERDGKSYGYISAETQDRGDASLAVTPWTIQQLNVMAAFNTACCVVYDLPCHEPETPTDGGIAHHSRHSAWSRTAHDCPRRARISQMDWLRGEVATRVLRYWGYVQQSGGIARAA